MKWTRIIVGLLATGLLAYLLFFAYPFALPLLIHHPHGWLVMLVTDVIQTKTVTANVFPYVLLGVGGTMYLLMVLDLKLQPKRAHGTSRFATWWESRRFGMPRVFPFLFRTLLLLVRLPLFLVLAPLRALGVVQHHLQTSAAATESRLVLGTYHGRLIALSEQQQESNILLTAPVGSGKTSKVIIRNILRERGHRSLVIPDVKGELVRITAGAVSRSHEVWVFDPLHPDQSQGYNPLAYIRAVDDAQEFARCWVANTGQSKEDFWPKSAVRLMTATMMHLHTAEPRAPFSRVADILVYSSYEQMKRTLVTSPLQKAREEVTALFEHLDKNPKLVGSLMADIGTRFELLASDQVRAVTAHHDIDFRAMAERPIALYLSIPRRYQDRYQPLLACLVMQMFTTWEARAEEEPTGQLPRGILCYMDEFANLGYIPHISSYISTLRHTRVALLLVLQSFSQLDEKYGKAVRESILTNTITHLLLPGAGLEEVRYYSEKIGDTTARTESRTTTGSGADARDGWTQGETRRRLLTEDELRRMPANRMLMVSEAMAPLMLRTKLYFKDRRIAHLANLPFRRVQVSQEPPGSPQTQIRLPTPSSAQQQPMVADSDQGEDNHQDNDQYFLQE